MLHEIITIKIIAFKINKDCVAIREYCAPKIVFGPGKLSGVSRNGPLQAGNHDPWLRDTEFSFNGAQVNALTGYAHLTLSKTEMLSKQTNKRTNKKLNMVLQHVIVCCLFIATLCKVEEGNDVVLTTTICFTCCQLLQVHAENLQQVKVALITLLGKTTTTKTTTIS